VTQALHVANGDTLNKKLSHAQSRISKALSSNKSTDQLIDDAFRSGLSRPPTTTERVERRSAHRLAMARSLGRSSKKPTVSIFKYTTGSMPGRPPREASA
jgi:hypothetical protein